MDRLTYRDYFSDIKGAAKLQKQCVDFYSSDIGKTVFLTREEAEKALKLKDGEINV